MNTATEAPRKFELGEVAYTSWGYSMTIVDFYVVVKRTQKSVWVAPIASKFDGPEGIGGGHVLPSDDREPTGQVQRFLIKTDSDGTEWAWMSKLDRSLRIHTGKPVYYNTYD